MTKKELVKVLEKMDDDLEIVIFDREMFQSYPVERVRVITANRNPSYGYYAGDGDDRAIEFS